MVGGGCLPPFRILCINYWLRLPRRVTAAEKRMASRRALKAAQAIREVVGMAILTDLRDPRIKNVTVTRVEVSPDMQNAKVFVSVMGDESVQKLAVFGLQSSAGFLQKKVSNRVELRYTPRLKFELDLGIKNAIAIEQILKEVLPPKPAAEGPAVDDDNLEQNQADESAADESAAGGTPVDHSAGSAASVSTDIPVPGDNPAPAADDPQDDDSRRPGA